MTELWGHVLAVQAGRRREVRVRLEVHDDGKVYEIGTTTTVPSGDTLTVGDHVALASLKQLTRAETSGLARETVLEEAKWEAAFALLPWWWPGGPRQRRQDRWDNGERPSWKIHWGAEPQYAAARPTQAELQEQILGPLAAPASGPPLDELRAVGRMTDAAYAQASGVRAQALASLDALRASGALTEAQYREHVARIP